MSYMVLEKATKTNQLPKYTTNNMSDQPNTTEEDDKPPILKSWNQLYLLVLIMHALIITIFYLFTQAYS